MKKNYKFLIVFFLIFFTSEVKSETFDLWLQSFKNYAIKSTLRKALKGTNRGVHNHYFHAGHASK